MTPFSVTVTGEGIAIQEEMPWLHCSKKDYSDLLDGRAIKATAVIDGWLCILLEKCKASDQNRSHLYSIVKVNTYDQFDMYCCDITAEAAVMFRQYCLSYNIQQRTRGNRIIE